MHCAMHISACMVFLIATIVVADPLEGNTVHIAGQTRVVDGCLRDGHAVPTEEQCSGKDGFCIESGDHCNGAVKILQTSCSDHCTCCVPVHKVSAAEQCSRVEGVCLDTGDRCNYGSIKMLENSCNDHCTCCVPDECPKNKGFFMLPESTQCLKVFMDGFVGTWTTVEAFCREQGLELAKPDDPVALQKYLHKKYYRIYDSNNMYYVDAIADGSNFKWQNEKHDGMVLDPDSPFWAPGQQLKMDTGRCLVLQAANLTVAPYTSWDCSVWHYSICEKMIME